MFAIFGFTLVIKLVSLCMELIAVFWKVIAVSLAVSGLSRT